MVDILLTLLTKLIGSIIKQLHGERKEGKAKLLEVWKGMEMQDTRWPYGQKLDQLCKRPAGSVVERIENEFI
ncbi:hypothetical protein EJB05_09387, partial [Eragrostis curvula]